MVASLAPRLDEVLGCLESHPGRVLTCIGLLFALMYVSSHALFPRDHGRIVNGDAIQYYAYLRSLAVDGDLDFRNDYRLINNPLESETTTQGEAGDFPDNFMSIGPALLWTPFFLLAGAGLGALQLTGAEVRLDGMSAPFTLSVGVSGIVYATAGFYLCYEVCRRLYVPAIAFWATLTVWLGTSAVYYSLVSPIYSHAVSLFGVTLFCYGWVRTRGQGSLGRYVLLGGLGGLAALMRWQDIIVILLPAVELLDEVRARRRPVSRAVVQAAVLGLAALVMLTPQMLAWHSIYGQFLMMPQGEGFMRWTTPAIASVLFSLNHGLFTWTPIVLVSVLGCWLLIRRDTVLGWSAVGIVAAAIYVNAAVSDWWAGEAFGARRFVGYSVFFSLGLAAFASAIWADRSRWVRWSAVAAVTYNLLFLFQYQVFMRGFPDIAPYPVTARQVFVDRFMVPWRVAAYWLKPD